MAVRLNLILKLFLSVIKRDRYVLVKKEETLLEDKEYLRNQKLFR